MNLPCQPGCTCRKHLKFSSERLEKMRIATRSRSDPAVLSARAKKAWAEGKYANRPEHSPETREKIRQALQNRYAGLGPEERDRLDVQLILARLTRWGARAVADRFWSHVDKSPGQGPNGTCWTWRLATMPFGYGAFRVGGKTVGAHRMAMELTHGEIPEGMCVLHRCDNPPCCNPADLFFGTVADNNADMLAKGRYVSGFKKHQ